jgi:methyl-accepting chemotaxis protein
MKTRCKLDSLSVKSKLFIPIGFVLTLVVAGATLLVVTRENHEVEHTYRTNFESIAISSRMMIHSAAEEYAKSKGLEFHRNAVWDYSPDKVGTDPGWKAMEIFMKDSSLKMLEEEREVNGVPTLCIQVPVRIEDECSFCHNTGNIDLFGDRKPGDLVAVFGVSGSIEELYARKRSTTLAAILIGGVVIILTGVVVHIFTTKLVLTPMCEAVAQLDKMAKADLRPFHTPALEARMATGDEIGKLARAFKGTLDELRATIQQVGSSTQAVASASSEISSTTEQMAAAAHEQTSQAGEVATAVEQMSKSILENSQNAQRASATAQQAKSIAVEGGNVVTQTVTSMRQIADVVEKSAVTVKALGESSNQIGEIIGVIDDIADQTNLLALNAAIEAARAGDQGRGFAVVAGEVRKLAERTTKATKEIAGMIRKIQAEAKNAVGSMQEGTSRMSEGIALADKAGSSLREIVAASENVTAMVDQMASANEEQSRTSEQISKNVDSISQVTSQSAQGTQQIAQAAEDLNRLTQNLESLILRFKLNQDHHTGHDSASGPGIQQPLAGVTVSPGGVIESSVHDTVTV